MEPIRPVKFTFVVGKYLHYIGIEFSDKSTACFTEQPEDATTPILGSDGTLVTPAPAPVFDKRGGAESGIGIGIVVQAGPAGTTEKSQMYEIALDEGEYVVEVWGRLFSRGTYVSSIGLYTNKERAFGPFGNTIGKPFIYTAPSFSHFLLQISAEGTKYNGYRTLKLLTPTWEPVPPRDAPLVYRSRMLSALSKRLTELKVIVENLSIYISRMVIHIDPDEEVLKILGLAQPDLANESGGGPGASNSGGGGGAAAGAGGGGSRKKGGFKKSASMGDLAQLKDHWAVTSFRLSDDVLGAVEEIRKSYPTTLNANAAALRMLTDIESYAQSLHDISLGYIEDDDMPFPNYASTMGHSNDIGSKVAFYIIPEADKRLVLAVERGQLNPGARIVATPFMRGDDSQLFIFTQKGMVRSLKSGLVLSVPLDAENKLVSGVQVTQEEEEEDPARMFRQRFTYNGQGKTLRVEASMEANASFYELDIPCLCLQLLDGSQSDEQGEATEKERGSSLEDDGVSSETKDVIVSTPLRDRSQKWIFKR